MAELSDRPVTIASLREDHLALMTRWYEENAQGSGELVGDALALREKVRLAGKDIGPRKERDEAQGIIDYWASSIASLPNQDFPEILTLEKYSGEAAKQASVAAEQVFNNLESEEERYVARQIFEKLLILDNGQVKRGPPMARAVMQQQVNNDLFDQVLDKFVSTGAVSELPGEQPDQDRLEVSDANIIENWPEVDDWLSRISDENEGLRSILRDAENWRAYGRDPLHLVSGKKTQRLDRFRGKSDLLDEYIDASQKQYGRFRWWMIAAGMVFVMVLFGMPLATYFGASWEIQSADRELIKESELVEDKQITELARQNVREISSYDSDIERRSQLLADPSLTGTMWLGSAEEPQVEWPDRRSSDPNIAAAKRGTTYRVKGNIYLRTGFPPEEGIYQSQPQKAIIPEGSRIILKGKAVPYDRPSGKQYWANVTVVPWVRLQYTNGTQNDIVELVKSLRSAGFDTARPRLTKAAVGKNMLQYSNHRSDRRIAAYLVRSLPNTTQIPALNNLQCQYARDAGIEGLRFVLELSIDFDSSGEFENPDAQSCADLNEEE